MKILEKKIIEDIIEKFISIQEIYHPLEDTQTDYSSVKAWIKIIKNDGYNDDMMIDVVEYIFKLIEKEKKEEATLLLLLSCATNDDLPMYILGRELYKGELFRENRVASFGIFTSLLEKNYSEAICDLAQFYRQGIYVKEDKKYAISLYRMASQLGLKRAYSHYLELTQK